MLVIGKPGRVPHRETQVVDSTRSVWSSTVFPTEELVLSWQWR
jgi:hypothetical protein